MCGDVMPYAVLGFLNTEGWSGEVWVLVQELVVRIFLLANEVDTSFGRIGVEVGVDCFERLQIDQASVAMIWREVKAGEEVGTDDGLLNVGDDKIERVIFATQSDSMSNATITGDRGAVGGGELGPVRTFLALGGERREY